MPTKTSYGSAKPSGVIILFLRDLKRLQINSMNKGGIFNLSIAFSNIVISTRSYALLKSWNIIQISFLQTVAYSLTSSRILMGSKVAPPGKPAKLPPFKGRGHVDHFLFILVGN